MTARHSSTTNGRDPLTIRTVEEAVTLAPYLLGFQPSESLVLIVADDGAACQGFVARADLDDLASTVAMDAFVSRVSPLAGRGRAVVLAFSRRQDRAMTIVATAFHAMEGMNIGDAAWTDGEYWRSIFCDERGCRDNHRFAPDPAISAEAVYRGLSVLPSRTSLVHALSGPGRTCDPDTRRQLANARRRLSRKDDDAVAARCQLLFESDEINDGVVTELVVAVQRSGVARRLWMSMERADASRWLTIWSRAVEIVPDRMAAAPLSLCGLAGWLSGEGAVAAVCARRCEFMAAAGTLSAALAVILDAFVPPKMWDVMDHDPAVIVDPRVDEADEGLNLSA
ncbi:DUF4192 domain-containing protein [Cutibacterium sp. WCA-380-WT-3A]|uniref:DUF4192 domain-containing protein n=1 Tax=Cutibacterium porci TaxID=2605781 RepID=A0A7K0J722_9ACTN|nr:DUF4192 domain-containing protein [Cutibacterium porci]MSS45754.1 DUF4192 domain-containing protein [Cutibacterium porci]